MTKISALSDIGTSVASNDVFVLVDVSNPTTPNKKVQQQNLLAAGGLLPDGSTATPGLRFLNDTDTGIYSSGSNTLGLVTGASTRLYIDSSGRVGLGTSSPGTGTSSFYDDLVVKNDGSGTGAGITIQSNSTNGFSGLDLRKTDGTELAKISASASTGKLSIDAGGSTAITVDSSRRVGIGTNSPGELLHLRAGSFSNTDLNSINNLIRITDLNSRYNGLETQIGNFKSGIRFDATQLNGATVYGSFIQQVVTSNNFTGGSTKMRTSLIFGTRGDAQSTPSDAPVERLRIKSDGTLMHLGAGNSTSPAVQFNGSAPANSMAMLSDGKVGIGTLSPSTLLEVSGGSLRVENFTAANNITLSTHVGNGNDSTLKFLKARGGDSTPAQIVVGDDLGSIEWQGYDGSSYNEAAQIRCKSNTNTGDFNAALVYNADNHVFQNSGLESARIDSSGRLLVGTSSSATGTESQYAKITVAGNTNSSTSAGILNIRKGSGAGATDYIGRVVYSDNDHDFAYIDSIADGSTTAGRLVFSTTADGSSSPTERMTIYNNGVISLGDSAVAGNYKVFAKNSANTTTDTVYYSELLSGSNSTSAAHFFAITQGINIWKLTGNGTSSFTSDERKKKNIETTRDGYLEDLRDLRVVKYNWINQDDDTPKELGLIAQEVEQIFPGLVTEEAEPMEGDDYKLKTLKGSVLPFMLLKALQEAAEKIETLEAKVAALEAA